jgi:hypothetical protein
VNKFFLIKQVGKGVGSVALAVTACVFAAYVRHAFGGLAFNLFADPSAKRSKKVRLMDQEEGHNPFNDMFNHFRRDD